MAGQYEDYLEFIKGLPSQQQPEIFGFHENANISKDLNETSILLSSLVLVQPSGMESVSSSGGAQTSSDDIIWGLCDDIMQKLPADFDLDMAQSKYPVNYFESTNTVLCQVFSRVLSSLRSLV
jgi:dynein heavy chain